jgi:heterodisulfide reductase subunit C
MPQSFNLALAPSQLTQTINPWSWTFGDMSLFTVNLGQSSDPQFEARVLEQVGTYGRQIGRIGEALDVILRKIDLGKLDKADEAAIKALRAQLDTVSDLKTKHGAGRKAA